MSAGPGCGSNVATLTVIRFFKAFQEKTKFFSQTTLSNENDSRKSSLSLSNGSVFVGD
jgi:hypothetical protein